MLRLLQLWTNLCFEYSASLTWLELLEEVIALVIYEDECREVFHLNLPDGFHSEFWVFDTLDALDVILGFYLR